MIRLIAIAVVFAGLAGPSLATGAWSLAGANSEFRRIGDRASFVQIVQDRKLKRFGITLEVNADGSIGGKAFGRPVKGAWKWQDGFFCRELFWGAREVGANCQEVTVSGGFVRFTSDRGTGDFADLRLR